MSGDYSKPSGVARWGWCWAALVVVGGLPNAVATLHKPSGLGVGLALFSLAATVTCLLLWRSTVKSDRERRRRATLTKIARLRGTR